MGAERTLKKVLMIVLAIFVAAAVLVFVLTHLFRGEPRTLELGSFETAATLQIDNYPVLGPTVRGKPMTQITSTARGPSWSMRRLWSGLITISIRRTRSACVVAPSPV